MTRFLRPLATAALLWAIPALAAPEDSSPGALARRICTSEGMWCRADHSRCCRGLKCENSRCKKKEAGESGKGRDKSGDAVGD